MSHFGCTASSSVLGWELLAASRDRTHRSFHVLSRAPIAVCTEFSLTEQFPARSCVPSETLVKSVSDMAPTRCSAALLAVLLAVVGTASTALGMFFGKRDVRLPSSASHADPDPAATPTSCRSLPPCRPLPAG